MYTQTASGVLHQRSPNDSSMLYGHDNDDDDDVNDSEDANFENCCGAVYAQLNMKSYLESYCLLLAPENSKISLETSTFNVNLVTINVDK